jgi:hypothetical protein
MKAKSTDAKSTPIANAPPAVQAPARRVEREERPKGPTISEERAEELLVDIGRWLAKEVGADPQYKGLAPNWSTSDRRVFHSSSDAARRASLLRLIAGEFVRIEVDRGARFQPKPLNHGWVDPGSATTMPRAKGITLRGEEPPEPKEDEGE